jgi:very-short-patch-repair endonuclease
MSTQIVGQSRSMRAIDLDDLRRRYRAGERMDDIQRALGIGKGTLYRRLEEIGEAPRKSPNLGGPKGPLLVRRRFTDEELRVVHAEYLAGKSIRQLARERKCDRTVFEDGFERLGLPMRSMTEAIRLQRQQLTPAQRKVLRAMNAKTRGRPQSYKHRCNRALAREALARCRSRFEVAIAEALAQVGLEFVREKAIGPYNVDFALAGNVAVEVFGGRWHNVRVKTGDHAKRLKYILDQGWHMVILWAGPPSPGEPQWARSMENIIAFAKHARRNPAGRREYRVLGCDGEFYTSGSAQSDHIAFVRSAKRR